MKKLFKILTILLVLFISFGFIVLNRSDSHIKLEKISAVQSADTGKDLAVIQDSNEEQW